MESESRMDVVWMGTVVWTVRVDVVVMGAQVWTVRVDVVVMEVGGNVEDAAVLAALVALRSLLIPHVEVPRPSRNGTARGTHVLPPRLVVVRP